MDANAEANIRNVATPEPSSPYEELIGAWSEDGQELLAAAPTVDELAEELDYLGVTRFLIGRVPPVDCWLGSLWDAGTDWEPDPIANQDGGS